MLEINEKGKKKYPLLFNPLKIGNLSIPNRIFFPPWVFNWAHEDGTVSQKLHDLYVNFAENGCGVVYAGGAAVSPDSLRFAYCMRLYDKQFVESNRKLCQEIEARDAIPAIQLINFGRQSVTTFTGKPILVPSNVPCKITSLCDPNYQLKEMTVEDIERIKHDYVNSAILAVESGYKIIQVHAAHGYLLSNFLSPYTNKRTDEYGGSIENRCRILVEIVEMIRKELSNSVVIDVRLSVDEFVEGGLVPADYATITPLIEKAGADMLNASATITESAVTLFPTPLNPEARYAYLAEILKKYSSLPVAHAAFIASLEKGEELIKEGKTDLVGYGRAQFADQGFVKKSVMGEKIHRCNWCGRCLGDLMDPGQLFSVHCSVNKRYKRQHKVNEKASM